MRSLQQIEAAWISFYSPISCLLISFRRGSFRSHVIYHQPRSLQLGRPFLATWMPFSTGLYYRLEIVHFWHQLGHLVEPLLQRSWARGDQDFRDLFRLEAYPRNKIASYSLDPCHESTESIPKEKALMKPSYCHGFLQPLESRSIAVKSTFGKAKQE